MRDFAKVSPRFWTGEIGRKLRLLHGDYQRVAFCLLTCPEANMIGLYDMSVLMLTHYLGMEQQKGLRSPFEAPSKPLPSPFEGVISILKVLENDVLFCKYDAENELVWIPEMAHDQIGPHLRVRDNKIKAVVKLLFPYRNHPYYQEFLERYQVPYNLKNLTIPGTYHGPRQLALEAPSKPLRSPFEAPSKPLRSPFGKEKEKEKEKEKGGETPPPDLSDPEGGNGKSHPDTPAGLVHSLACAISERHPEFVYQPGLYAEKDAQEFLAAFVGPREGLAAQIQERIEQFARDPAGEKEKWSVKEFLRRYNSLGTLKRPAPSPREDLPAPPPPTEEELEEWRAHKDDWRKPA
jgi:hypothetical protein